MNLYVVGRKQREGGIPGGSPTLRLSVSGVGVWSTKSGKDVERRTREKEERRLGVVSVL